MLSERLRIKYNLWLYRETGLNPEEEELLTRLDRCELAEILEYLNTDRGKVAALLKGSWAERLFVAAWADKDYTSLGIRCVVPADRYQNRHEKTDAVMTLTNGFSIRIQIKSRLIYDESFLKHARNGILILRVRLSDTPEQIRQNTINACLRYNEIVTSK